MFTKDSFTEQEWKEILADYPLRYVSDFKSLDHAKNYIAENLYQKLQTWDHLQHHRQKIYNSQDYFYYKGLEDALCVVHSLAKSIKEPVRWLNHSEVTGWYLLQDVKHRLIDQIKSYPWVSTMIERTICSKN